MNQEKPNKESWKNIRTTNDNSNQKQWKTQKTIKEMVQKFKAVEVVILKRGTKNSSKKGNIINHIQTQKNTSHS